MSDNGLDEIVFSMILDLMQLESSFVSTDINAVYRTKTCVRESINNHFFILNRDLPPGIKNFRAKKIKKRKKRRLVVIET
jgi:hypothetical protein